MTLIDKLFLENLSSSAATADRRRQHHNFHESYDSPCQRMLVAIEPGSYIRPHRHLIVPKPECFLVVKGKLGYLTFTDDGAAAEVLTLMPAGDAVGIDLPPGIWHTVIALETGTVFLETKPGPYTPIPDADFAPWAPREGTHEVKNYLETLYGYFSCTL